MAGKNPKSQTAAKARKPAGSDSLLGWLGRQVGHVKKAIGTDVAKPAKAKNTPRPAQAKEPLPAVIYRQDKVEEADMPNKPGVKLRRTIIDEVIVSKREKS